jgi:hypothetical protein
LPSTVHDAAEAFAAAIDIVNAFATEPDANDSGCDCTSGGGVTKFAAPRAMVVAAAAFVYPKTIVVSSPPASSRQHVTPGVI